MDGSEPDTGPSGTDQPSAVTKIVRAIGFMAVLVGVAIVAGGLALLYPYLRDDYALDGAVQAVALDWRDFGESKARERLSLERAEAAVGPWVPEEACAFEEREGERIVRCAWAVEVRLPGALTVPLAFASEARIDPTGDLR